MTFEAQSTTSSIHSSNLVKRILVGAAIGLFLIGAFLLTAGEPNPDWGKFWRIRPLIIVPLAGATAGLFHHYLDQYLGNQGFWPRVVVIVLSLLGYLVALWLGSVLGLDGTYWN